MPRARDPAIPDRASADATLRRPTPPRRRGDTPASGRVSPPKASRRTDADLLLADARPWALHQAGRAYAHLPLHLQELAVDRALADLRTSIRAPLGRHALYARLGESLTAALQAVHAAWCLDSARSRWGVAPRGEDERPGRAIAAFVEHGLAGLERAVLQLEIGAARDSATARAALRLGPREYRRHRERGLAKLQAAIAGLVRARVCDDHLDAVTLAATGDPRAAGELGAGPRRCRACAREAAVVRGVLHERLAVAPWPLLVKPAGLLAAKLGLLEALTGGTGGTGALTAGAAKGAVVIAATLGAAGGAAAVKGAESGPAGASAAPKVAERAPAAARVAAPVRAPRARRSQPDARRQAAVRRPRTAPLRSAGRPTAPQAEPVGTGTVIDAAPQAVERLSRTVAPLRKAVDDAVARVTPPVAEPVVQRTLDDLAETTEGLLGQP